MLPPPPPSPRSAIADGRLHRADAFPEQWHSRRLGCGKYTLKEYRMVSGQEAVQAIQDGVIRAGYVHAGDRISSGRTVRPLHGRWAVWISWR